MFLFTVEQSWWVDGEAPDLEAPGDETIRVVAAEGDEAITKSRAAAVGMEVLDNEGAPIGTVTNTTTISVTRASQIDVL